MVRAARLPAVFAGVFLSGFVCVVLNKVPLVRAHDTI